MLTQIYRKVSEIFFGEFTVEITRKIPVEFLKNKMMLFLRNPLRSSCGNVSNFFWGNFGKKNLGVVSCTACKKTKLEE